MILAEELDIVGGIELIIAAVKSISFNPDLVGEVLGQLERLLASQPPDGSIF